MRFKEEYTGPVCTRVRKVDKGKKGDIGSLLTRVKKGDIHTLCTKDIIFICTRSKKGDIDSLSRRFKMVDIDSLCTRAKKNRQWSGLHMCPNVRHSSKLHKSKQSNHRSFSVLSFIS